MVLQRLCPQNLIIVKTTTQSNEKSEMDEFEGMFVCLSRF